MLRRKQLTQKDIAEAYQQGFERGAQTGREELRLAISRVLGLTPQDELDQLTDRILRLEQEV